MLFVINFLGKVVEEWDTDGFKLNAILPESKDSQTQGSDCFVGVNNNGFFVVDPRSSKKVRFFEKLICFNLIML